MFRNREIRQFTLVFVIISAAVLLAGLAVHPAAAILSVLSAAAYGTAFFVFTKARYRRIMQISDQIDRVLHNADHLYIGDTEEGELSILQSEITKMTLRIREQNAALIREKEHLADSLADIAHQLRTPLTSVNLILSLLENTSDETERRNLLREMEELLLRMDWLITSLLKLSRLDAGIVTFKKESVEVSSLVTAALRPFLITMELHNLEVRTEIPREIYIQGDFEWLSEAVQNILKNGMESAGDHGRIEIICKDTLLYTELSIHDSGPGFAKEDLPCLFDRYYRGKNSSAAGYGIGLALCRTIITRQGGTVMAKNHPGGGAVFTIRFPK